MSCGPDPDRGPPVDDPCRALQDIQNGHRHIRMCNICIAKPRPALWNVSGIHFACQWSRYLTKHRGKTRIFHEISSLNMIRQRKTIKP